MEESTTLDVLYAPIVKLERAKGDKLQRMKMIEKLREKKKCNCALIFQVDLSLRLILTNYKSDALQKATHLQMCFGEKLEANLF